MLKKQTCLACYAREIEGVLHQENNVNIVWFSFGCNERSKDNEASQLIGASCEQIYSTKALGHSSTLQ